MTEVKCRVESCHYWGSGDICNAETIQVDNNVSGSRTFGMETGELYSGKETHRTQDVQDKEHARTSEQTLCRTFRPKGSPSVR